MFELEDEAGFYAAHIEEGSATQHLYGVAARSGVLSSGLTLSASDAALLPHVTHAEAAVNKCPF